MSARIFVDCGGYDGCSVLQFLSRRPAFQAITFEPNPAFWGYYGLIPTRLVRKAVAAHDGTVEFTVDPLDGDGSSIVPAKSVVFDGSLPNERCPRLTVPCVDLSRFLAATVRPGDTLCLKLDVEGAEYAILEKMIEDGTIDLVSELFVEFHWDRCGVPESRHLALKEELARHTSVTDWNRPKELSVHTGGRRSKLRRALVLAGLWPRHVVSSRLPRSSHRRSPAMPVLESSRSENPATGATRLRG
jgi:FkbM family methyltransferase